MLCRNRGAYDRSSGVPLNFSKSYSFVNRGGVAAAMAPGAPCAPAGGPPGGPPGGAPPGGAPGAPPGTAAAAGWFPCPVC